MEPTPMLLLSTTLLTMGLIPILGVFASQSVGKMTRSAYQGAVSRTKDGVNYFSRMTRGDDVFAKPKTPTEEELSAKAGIWWFGMGMFFFMMTLTATMGGVIFGLYNSTSLATVMVSWAVAFLVIMMIFGLVLRDDLDDASLKQCAALYTGSFTIVLALLWMFLGLSVTVGAENSFYTSGNYTRTTTQNAMTANLNLSVSYLIAIGAVVGFLTTVGLVVVDRNGKFFHLLWFEVSILISVIGAFFMIMYCYLNFELGASYALTNVLAIEIGVFAGAYVLFNVLLLLATCRRQSTGVKVFAGYHAALVYVNKNDKNNEKDKMLELIKEAMRAVMNEKGVPEGRDSSTGSVRSRGFGA